MRSKHMRTILTLALAVSALATAPAQAVSFNLVDTGGAGIGTQARTGFEIATNYWSSVFTDNITINLDIGFRTLGTGILGSTGSARSLLSINQGYAALATDMSSALDVAAVNNLAPRGLSTIAGLGSVTAITNAINATNNGYVDSATRIDNDRGINNSTLAVTKASAKALALTTDVNGAAINYATPDGAITFSDAFAFDFDPRDGILSNAFDFVGVAIHEIGHALGFVSGVDSYDGRTGPGGPNATRGLLENSVVMNSLDLFRYSSEGQLDWSTSSASKYFSIDGGETQLFGDSRFALGSFNGDGRQASHWKDSAANTPQLGILDPTSGRGQMQEVTALDLAAYDAIGWDVSFDVLANAGYRLSTADIYTRLAGPIPEPATWAMMLVGFGMVGAATRYRRRRTTAAIA